MRMSMRPVWIAVVFLIISSCSPASQNASTIATTKAKTSPTPTSQTSPTSTDLTSPTPTDLTNPTPTALTGPTPTAPASASPAPLPPPPSGVLFAVVEGPTAQPNVVAIVGLDGYARAKASFQPRLLPKPCGISAEQQLAAQVVNQAVYYIDGQGVVRVLKVGQQPQVIATFIQPPDQYQTWFAVSPDGSQTVAGIITYPPSSTTPYCAQFQGIFYFDYELFSGGAEHTLVHSAGMGTNGGPQIQLPVTWRDGKAVIIGTGLSTPVQGWPSGVLVEADSSDHWGGYLGGQFCLSASITTAGLIPCSSSYNTHITVHQTDGTLVWTTSLDTVDALKVHLSPDGQSITDGTKVETRASGLVAMPPGFLVEGWLDNNRVVGRPVNGTGEGDLSWISLADPATVHDLGFKGDFVGTLG